MSKTKRTLLIIGASILGLILVVLIAAIVTIQTSWFANFVRQKVIASVEDSTGGVVQVGRFEFDLRHLTVRAHDFVLHGTEPQTADPLLRIKLLELHVKLFSGLKQTLDLQYLGVEQPRVNLMLLPDGSTNIPNPKSPKQPSENSGLETVVNLAVNEFRVDGGYAIVSQQATAFSGQGQNLRVLLSYNLLTTSYSGTVKIDPLLLTSGKRPPLAVHVDVPVTLEKDAIKVAGARFTTDRSKILADASLQNMNAPVLSAHLNADVFLPEMQRSLELPVNANARGAPKNLTAELVANLNTKTNALQIQTAHLGLGKTTMQASGSLDGPNRGKVDFNANLALDELARLEDVSGVHISGDLVANGHASLDTHNNYAVDGTLNAKDLSARSDSARISRISLYSPFHADPYLVSLDGLKLNALGGSLAAKIFLAKLQDLSVEGQLKSFSIQVLAAALTGKRLGYDGFLSGSLVTKANLKAKGVTGYRAQTNLSIAPGRLGVPLSGHIQANYNGANGLLDLAQSYLAMPNSRLDVSGAINRRLDLNLVSRNLNDFLPAANFGSAKPLTTFPITLRGGAASVQAQVTGNLAAPNVAAHLELSNFVAQQRQFQTAKLDLSASPNGADVRNGSLQGIALNAMFDASIGLRRWEPQPRSPLTANLVLRNGDLADLLSLAGEGDIPAAGQVTADIHVSGTYGDPLGNVALQVAHGSIYQQPFSKLYTALNLSDRLITLSSLELDTAGGQIVATGTFRHPAESFTAGHAELQLGTKNLQLAQVQALAKQNAGIAGSLQLNANASGDLSQAGKEAMFKIANLTANLTANNLQVQHQDAGDLTLTAQTAGDTVQYNVASDFAGSQIKVAGRTALTKDYATTADASIKSLSVKKALQLAGQGAIPASGVFSTEAHVSGTMQAPNASLSLQLVDAKLYGEVLNRLDAQLAYTATEINITNASLTAPAGNITLSGDFTHPANNLKVGSLKLKTNSSDIDVAKIAHVQTAEPGLAGTIRLAADLAGTLQDKQGVPPLSFSRLQADISTSPMRLKNRDFGSLKFAAHTTGTTLDFGLDSDLAQAQVHGTGRAQLTGEHPLNANITFANVRYTNLAPLLSKDGFPPPFEGLVEGNVAVNGPFLNPSMMSGRLEVDRLDLHTNPQASPTGTPAVRTFSLQNQGPIVVSLARSVLNVEQLNIGGRDTVIKGSGTVNLADANEPLNLNLAANVNLSLLEQMSRDFYSSGNLSLNTAIRGTFAQPRANGRIELKKANVNYSASPNGLSNANGVILLNGTNASIETLTAESGGGKVTVSGFAGLGAGVPNFNVRVSASRVRVRYAGASVTSDAGLSMIGNLNRSLLAGTITIQRVAYASTSDIGSVLSSASAPPSTPASPSPLLSGMKLDVHILTAPDLQVVSTYANRLSVLANLNIRGTAETPGVLGRVSVTDGQLVFFGNSYTVTTGTINFYNPNAIAPILNVSLDTIAQGVDVTIGVTGPMDDLKLSYRSDPPLSFEQIVQLLATNTTPSNPVIAAHQPAPASQSLSQMGESALLGQAVANPLATRVQRVFGLSQFKIDPSFAGNGGGPSARVTLQQKIASNITFTYITDVTQTNGQIIRIQWDLTNSLSAVGLRDYNGNVSVEMFYKFTKR